MRTSIQNSLLVAAIVTPICLVLGTLSAFALTRMRFRLRSGTGLLVAAPLVVPWLVIGISALLFFNRASLPFVGQHAALADHGRRSCRSSARSRWSRRSSSARLARFDRTQEEAAIDLGASQIADAALRRAAAPLLGAGRVGDLRVLVELQQLRDQLLRGRASTRRSRSGSTRRCATPRRCRA